MAGTVQWDWFEAVPAVPPERVCVAVIVNLETGRDKQPDALERLTQLVRDDLDRVNELILQNMQSPVALIPSWRAISSRRAASACGRS